MPKGTWLMVILGLFLAATLIWPCPVFAQLGGLLESPKESLRSVDRLFLDRPDQATSPDYSSLGYGGMSGMSNNPHDRGGFLGSSNQYTRPGFGNSYGYGGDSFSYGGVNPQTPGGFLGSPTQYTRPRYGNSYGYGGRLKKTRTSFGWKTPGMAKSRTPSNINTHAPAAPDHQPLSRTPGGTIVQPLSRTPGGTIIP